MSWPMMGQMISGRTGGHHLDFYPIATSEVKDALRAAETVYQLALQQIPEEVEESQALLIYPEVEGDAVTITARDMEELLPERFLGNHIVDFYIRYLERGLSPERRSRFYFFNSFFFTKLLQSTPASLNDPCKVDYEQLRSWTKEVNLFEKDYVFIPIVERSHWSLVIICNLGSLTRAPDEMTRFPCIVHLDPKERQHESFEGLIKSYVLEAWMDRFQPSIDRDQFRHQLRALYQMKYIQAEVPQQDNSHDCGLYVLHYIESFLEEFTSPESNFASSERVLRFAHPHFAVEVLSKRRHIQNLILELSGIFQERARKQKAIKHLVQELMQTSQKLQAHLEDEGNSKACIDDILTTSPTILNAQVFEMNHTSIREDSMYAQHDQSSGISRPTNEPLSGLQIGPMGYENRCERLSLQLHHVELEVQTTSPRNCGGPISETKHALAHEDATNVQHQQSSGISKLDYESSDVKFQRVTKSFSDKHQHPKLGEVACVELSNALKGNNKRARNMTEEETSVLLLCKLEGGRFCKGSKGTTHWNLISEEIEKKLGSVLSADQCRLRYDTLMKAYKTYKKYCMKTSKTFSNITNEERLDLKLATTLSEEWYTSMDEICNKANVSQKRMKLSSNVCNDMHLLSSQCAPNPPSISNGRSFEDTTAISDSVCGILEVALCNVIPTSVLSSLNEDLLSTLLNLVHECSWTWNVGNKNKFYLDKVCPRLAILQDREPREILDYVFKLWELKLVSVVDMDFEEGNHLTNIHLWEDKEWFINLVVYEKISKEVLHKNPHLKTYCARFPIKQSSLQYIRVLRLLGCHELKHLNLVEFPNLQFLSIWDCPQLHSVTGWEVATGLGSLGIGWCNAYHNFPNLQYMSSLREISVSRPKSIKSAVPWQLSHVSQCAKLQRLMILSDKSLSPLADVENLKDLKFLEFLSFGSCNFSNIQGLSGLQALTSLELEDCKGLRRVPELGCLKGLTYLNMSFSSVEDVVGVGELHLLTLLDLSFCESLKWLPFLGHLTALVSLNLHGTRVKEIPGSEDLINLKTLCWSEKSNFGHLIGLNE